MRRIRAALGALLALAGTACGYHWVRSDRALGPVRTVTIRTLENDSTEPALEMMVTEALLEEFTRRGGVRLVDDPQRADLVLSGAVRPVETRRASLSSTSFALEMEVTLRLDLEARRATGTAVALDPLTLAESELYLASPDVEATRKNREEALRRLAGLLAERVHDALSQGLSR